VRGEAALLRHAEAGLLTTQDAFYDGPDPLTPEPDLWQPARRQLHAQLVADQLGAGPPPEEPTAYFTIGPMGAGKTSLLRRLVHAHREIHRVETSSSLTRVAADELREALPEFASGLGNQIVVPECYDVTYGQVFPAALAAGHDVVYDTIGTLSSKGEVTLLPNLRALRDAGFRIHVLLAQAPLSACVERAKHRALHDNGRLIHASQHAMTHAQPDRVLERLLAEPDLLHAWGVIDTYSVGPAAPMLRGSDEWLDLYPRLRDTL
jgi:UDP:flavonoid glycosyltransferase YjiC (YdhE family)